MISVDLGKRGYDILIRAGILAEAGAQIRERLGPRRIVIVADKNAASHYLRPLTQSLLAAGHTVSDPILVNPGEDSKSFASLETVCEQILATTPDRHTLLIALGGGVIGDLAGFAAAIVMRGLDFVQIPTTLLAQVDSSVGGKTGINAHTGKNLIGAFHQPRLVIVDTDTLHTLPRREVLSGYAEIVKHGLIVDRALFDHLEIKGRDLVAGDEAERIHAITKSCEIKAAIVSGDEEERGDRALLNLGHTFGHALEALTGFGKILAHGEAVAIGCVLAFALSVELGHCPAGDLARVTAHLAAVGLPTAIDPAWDIEPISFIEAMRGDKKNAGGKIRFILANGIGYAFQSEGIDEARLAAWLHSVTRRR